MPRTSSFTDYDTAGMTIQNKIAEGFALFCPNREICISRIALSTEQVHQLNLPTRPAKALDRKQGFEACFELDAVEPNTLRQWVENEIINLIDIDKAEQLRQIEALQREKLIEYAKNLPK